MKDEEPPFLLLAKITDDGKEGFRDVLSDKLRGLGVKIRPADKLTGKFPAAPHSDGPNCDAYIAEARKLCTEETPIVVFGSVREALPDTCWIYWVQNGSSNHGFHSWAHTQELPAELTDAIRRNFPKATHPGEVETPDICRHQLERRLEKAHVLDAVAAWLDIPKDVNPPLTYESVVGAWRDADVISRLRLVHFLLEGLSPSTQSSRADTADVASDLIFCLLPLHPAVTARALVGGILGAEVKEAMKWLRQLRLHLTSTGVNAEAAIVVPVPRRGLGLAGLDENMLRTLALNGRLRIEKGAAPLRRGEAS